MGHYSGNSQTDLPVPPIEKVSPVKLEPRPPRETPSPVESSIIKLAVIVGHEKKAPGARMTNGKSEYDYNSEVATLMKLAAKAKPVVVETIFRDRIGISGAYEKAAKLGADCVIELHFNAFNTVVHGTETLCTADARDVEFAGIVHEKVCEVFQRNGLSRGVKKLARSARGGNNVHSFAAGVNCLVEPFFGDNREDARLASILQTAYAKALVEAVEAWGIRKELL